MSNSTVANADGSPLILNIQNVLKTNSIAAYGTVPDFATPYSYTVSPLSATNWNMMG